MVNEPDKVLILDVPISRMNLQEALAYCRNRVDSGLGGYFCFANVHTVTEARYSEPVKKVMQGATLNFADGIPLSWISRLKGKPVRSRVCGPDFMPLFLKRYPHLRHGFLGGSPSQGEALSARFDLKAASYSPPMRAFSTTNAKEDWEKLVQASPTGEAPEIVWVGLGAPKQEMWMNSVTRLAPTTLFFGVGAAFDFLSETKTRAPRWMQKTGLEWFFRLAQEPSRLAGRYLSTNLKFIYSVIRDFFYPPRTR